ncbi:hypothetical protein HYV31_01975 [candidate division WWE3 bacterium]|nr:hypothetical protein [candidate division WWE3 bacterium]
MPTNYLKQIPNILLVLVFCIVLWLPAVQMKYHVIKPSVTIANEPEFKLPIFDTRDIVEFIDSFEKAFNKSFGFRETLIRLNNKYTLKYFGYSNTANAVQGRDDWLFFGPGLFDSWKRGAYTNYWLDSIKATTSNTSKLLAEKNILYITVVTPDKHSIYPEYLPVIDKKDLRSPRLDQRLQVLSELGEPSELNLLNPLKQAKNYHQLYFKTDTHWNQYGSFIGYQEIMKKIKIKYPNIQILEEQDFDIVNSENSFRGDIAKNLLLDTKEDDYIFNLKETVYKNKLQEKNKINKAVIYVDSFFDPKYPWGAVNFIKLHFKEVLIKSNSGGTDQNLIDQEKPDVVIYQITERSI